MAGWVGVARGAGVNGRSWEWQGRDDVGRFGLIWLGWLGRAVTVGWGFSRLPGRG